MKNKLAFLFISMFCHYLHGEQKPLVVIIPSYNNKEFYERNLRSVFSQNYDNFRVIYVDDASTDETGALVQRFILDIEEQHRVTLILNKERKGALANIFLAAWKCAPAEIIVNLDGDDWLARPDVFSLLNTLYADSGVWLTYGKSRFYPGNFEPDIQEIPKEIIEKNDFRVIRGTGTTALRTFYAGLFQQIKKEDLLFNGEFFSAAYDMAIMFPMLEMAGIHSKFIPQICYIYNSETLLNDHRIRREEQMRIDEYVRLKEKYQPLDHFLRPMP